jgi:(2Fe-2S) ferredoxin
MMSSDNAVDREHPGKKKLTEKVRELHPGTHQHHIFLCADQTEPKCCSREVGLASWEYLKQELRKRGLDVPGKVYRTNANCLRMCAMGPIAVVHPDNIWYHSCTPQVLDRIIEEHLVNGRPVEEYRIRAVTEGNP